MTRPRPTFGVRAWRRFFQNSGPYVLDHVLRHHVRETLGPLYEQTFEDADQAKGETIYQCARAVLCMSEDDEDSPFDL
jgi:hypothetical protein